jgi:hypothetical protein
LVGLWNVEVHRAVPAPGLRFTRLADEEPAKTALGGGESKPCGAVLLNFDPENAVPRSTDRTL